MMWPFTRKQEEIAPEVLREFLSEDKPVIIPRGFIIAKGGDVRRAQTLKEKLIANRIYRKKGKGEAYWDSVIEIIEKHYKRPAN